MLTAQSIWNDALEYLKSELTVFSFNELFKDLKAITLHDDKFILEAPSVIVLNMLKERYLLLTADAVRRVCGRDYKVTLITPDERNKYIVQPAIQQPQNEGSVFLNPKYTFDTFVIGSSNRFAHAAALAVAQQPAKSYNPLFIYGGVGLGKTHLLHAIGHYIYQKKPSANIVYVTSEMFTNELINSIQTRKNAEFRNKYRNVDVLMIDDIQFIASRESTQEEFFHTFNTLHGANKQIVISSDKPPKEIKTLEERLRSRFEWGLIADIQVPDLETRIAIMRNKASQDHLMIDDEVTQFIASKVESNIRELEGCLTKLMAYSRLTGKPANIDLAEEALKDVFPQTSKKRITLDLIKEVVADFYSLDVEDISARRRERRIAYPRQVAMYIAQKYTDSTLNKIGESFGGLDHSTVLHGCKKLESEIQNDVRIKTDIEDILKRIKE